MRLPDLSLKPLSINETDILYIYPHSEAQKGLAVFLWAWIGCRDLKMGENCRFPCDFFVFVADLLNFRQKKSVFCEIYIKFARLLEFLSLIAI